MEDTHLTNQRYRIAFMRGFERGCTAIIGQYNDYKDVQFDGEITVSNGHFADHVEII
jgi:hypothetical protein